MLSSPEPFDWERIILDLRRLLPSLPVLDPVIPSTPFPPKPPVTFPPPTSGVSLTEVEVSSRIIRNRDGTCAFLIALANSRPIPLEAGNYTLKGTFKRNPGNSLPILSERGSISEEESSITWTL